MPGGGQCLKIDAVQHLLMIDCFDDIPSCNAMTAGQGRYSLALSHYAAVPPAVQQQLVSQYQQPTDE